MRRRDPSILCPRRGNGIPFPRRGAPQPRGRSALTTGRTPVGESGLYAPPRLGSDAGPPAARGSKLRARRIGEPGSSAFEVLHGCRVALFSNLRTVGGLRPRSLEPERDPVDHPSDVSASCAGSVPVADPPGSGRPAKLSLSRHNRQWPADSPASSAGAPPLGDPTVRPAAASAGGRRLGAPRSRPAGSGTTPSRTP
jgi:hypothetical protein